MSRRARTKELNRNKAEIAVFARQSAKDGAYVDYDDDLLPWIWDEESEAWLSFDGNYSSYSPTDKRELSMRHEQNALMRDERAAVRLEIQIAYSMLRQSVLERDNCCCQLCGAAPASTSKLHIHHIHKRSEGGPDTFDNLITVCPTCHKKADGTLYNPPWHQGLSNEESAISSTFEVDRMAA